MFNRFVPIFDTLHTWFELSSGKSINNEDCKEDGSRLAALHCLRRDLHKFQPYTRPHCTGHTAQHTFIGAKNTETLKCLLTISLPTLEKADGQNWAIAGSIQGVLSNVGIPGKLIIPKLKCFISL